MPSSDTVKSVIYGLTPDVISSSVPSNSVTGTLPADTFYGSNSLTVQEIVSLVWLCGVIVMLALAAIGYLRLLKRVRMSVKDGDGIFLCDNISSPFILGIFRPRIYLPSEITNEERMLTVAHERAHLSRHDNKIKPFAFCLLSIHWFNPFCWLAYAFLSRDIETACDEKVADSLSFEQKKEYSRTLLRFASSAKICLSSPLAFGEVGVKTRVKRLLNVKKPTFWVIAAVVVLTAATTVTLLTNPVDKTKTYSYEGLQIDSVSFDGKCAEPKEVGFSETDGKATLSVTYKWKSSTDANEIKLDRYTLSSISDANVISSDDKNQISNVSHSDKSSTYIYTLPLTAKDYGIYYFEQTFTRNGESGKLSVNFKIVEHEEDTAAKSEPIQEKVSSFAENISKNKSLSFSENGKNSEVLRCELQLSSDGIFDFCYDVLSSYWPRGNYEYSADTIVCTTSDGKYVYRFKILSDSEVSFSAEGSSPVRPRVFSNTDGELLKDGTVFKITK